jgi:hypothetical protein
MEPRDCHDTPIRKVLRFIRSVGLTEGWTRRRSTIDLRGHSAMAGWIFVHPFTYILTFLKYSVVFGNIICSLLNFVAHVYVHKSFTLRGKIQPMCNPCVRFTT